MLKEIGIQNNMLKEIGIQNDILKEIAVSSVKASKEHKELHGCLLGILNYEETHALVFNNYLFSKNKIGGNSFIEKLKSVPSVFRHSYRAGREKIKIERQGKKPFLSFYESQLHLKGEVPESIKERIRRRNYETMVLYSVKNNEFSAMDSNLNPIPIITII